jgi:hypothetical protein
MMEHLARIKKEDRERVEQFLLMEDWRKRISGVIVMTASPENSMAREKGDLPVEGARGSIMNEQWLSQFKENIRKTCERLEKEFRVFQVDTSQKEEKDNRKRTAQKVAGIVLDLIAEQLEEDILCAPKAELVALFSGKAFVVGKAAEAVASHFVKSGDYVPRAKAESAKDLLQALPIVIVRNKSGRVLQLLRREKIPGESLERPDCNLGGRPCSQRGRHQRQLACPRRPAGIARRTSPQSGVGILAACRSHLCRLGRFHIQTCRDCLPVDGGERRR